MQHVSQPSPKSCGQTVLAMVTGIDVASVIAEISDRTGTTGKQLCTWLSARGWSTTSQPVRYLPERGPAQLGAVAILRVIWEEKRHRTHWALWAEGGVWDPAFDHASHLDRFPDALRRPSLPDLAAYADLGGRVMSYLPLNGARPCRGPACSCGACGKFDGERSE